MRKGVFIILIILFCQIGKAQTILYNQNFGSGTAFPAGWTASGAQSTNLTVNTSSSSSGYTLPTGTNASGNSNVTDGYPNSTLGTSILTVAGVISTSGQSGIKVTYGARKTNAYTGAITFEWSSNGTTWTAITYTDVTNNASWKAINGGSAITLPAGADNQANLRFRWTFVRTNTSGNYRIDDFIVYTGSLATPTFTELVTPKYIGSQRGAGTNNAHTTIAVCFQMDNLTANTTYNFRCSFCLATDAAAATPGAGNIWSTTTSAFVAASTNSFTITTNSVGSTLPFWIYLEPTGNARFATTVTNLVVRIMYSTAAFTALTPFNQTSVITPIDVSSTAASAGTTDDGAFLKLTGVSGFSGKYALVFSNTAGTGNPLFSYQFRSTTPTQSNQTELPVAINDIYRQAGTSAIGDAPQVIPIGANNPSGVQRVEIRNSDNSIFAYFTKTNGIWDDGTTTQNTTTIARTAVQTISLLKGVYDDVGIYGDLTEAGNMTVTGTLDISGTSGLSIATNTLTLNGIITSSSILTGSSTSNLTISGTTAATVGTLNFASGSQTLSTLTMDRTGVTGTAALLGSSNDLTTTNLVLNNGILTTGNNLLTVTNVSGSASAASAWAANSTEAQLQTSFVALCDGSGNPITDTTGVKGFKIKSVGSTEKIIPIGYNYSSTPNRMALKDEAANTADDYTITLFKGDILGTPKPRVNRIWHIKKATSASTNISMKLYFFKRTALYGSATNDEIEDGFIWNDARLLHRVYANTIPNGGFTNTSSGVGTDVIDFTGSITPTEVYAAYTFGVSGDNTAAQTKNGITDFSGISYFSVANVENFILPVTIVNLKAYQQGTAIKIDWTALTENNVARYEVQRAANTLDFTAIGTQAASAVFAQEKNYSFTDLLPLNGNNYYRISAIDKDGKVIVSNIVMVTVGNGKEGISIYPNPVKGKAATIQFTNMKQGKYNIVVYSASGTKLLQKTIEHVGGSAAYQFILPQSLASGMYHLRIMGDAIKVEKNLLVE